MQLPALAGSFLGGDFSTGEVGNFHPALTLCWIWDRHQLAMPEISRPSAERKPPIITRLPG